MIKFSLPDKEAKQALGNLENGTLFIFEGENQKQYVGRKVALWDRGWTVINFETGFEVNEIHRNPHVCVRSVRIAKEIELQYD